MFFDSKNPIGNNENMRNKQDISYGHDEGNTIKKKQTV